MLYASSIALFVSYFASICDNWNWYSKSFVFTIIFCSTFFSIFSNIFCSASFFVNPPTSIPSIDIFDIIFVLLILNSANPVLANIATTKIIAHISIVIIFFLLLFTVYCCSAFSFKGSFTSWLFSSESFGFTSSLFSISGLTFSSFFVSCLLSTFFVTASFFSFVSTSSFISFFSLDSI